MFSFFFSVLFADEKVCEIRVTERSDMIRGGFPMRFAQLHISTHGFGEFFSFFLPCLLRGFVLCIYIYIYISPFSLFLLQAALPGA